MGQPQLTKCLSSQNARFTLDVYNQGLMKFATRFHTFNNIKDEPKIHVAVPKTQIEKGFFKRHLVPFKMITRVSNSGSSQIQD